MRISDWSSDVCSSDLWWGGHERRLERYGRNLTCRRCRALACPSDVVGLHAGRAREVQSLAQAIAGERPGLRGHQGALDQPGWSGRRRGDRPARGGSVGAGRGALHGTVVRSEEHTSELQSLMRISYAVFCLKKKKTNTQ